MKEFFSREDLMEIISKIDEYYLEAMLIPRVVTKEEVCAITEKLMSECK